MAEHRPPCRHCPLKATYAQLGTACQAGGLSSPDTRPPTVSVQCHRLLAEDTLTGMGCL